MGNLIGNRSSFTPLQEEGKGEKKDLIVGPGSSSNSKYGAMAGNGVSMSKQPERLSNKSIQEADIMKPSQVVENGDEDQNQLVLPNNGAFPYRVIGNMSKAPTMIILCRIISALVVLSFFIITFSFLIDILVRPTSYSEDNTIQGSVIVLLEKVNPFWYTKATVSKPKSSYDIQIGWVECDQLPRNSKIFNGHYNGRKATTDISYQQLMHFEPYSYLVEGSWIKLDINITSPPNMPGKNLSLLYYSSRDEYDKLLNPSTASKSRFDMSIPLNSAIGIPNKININVTETAFIFFAVKIPAGTDYTYNFTVNRVSFNDSTIDYQCYLSADDTSCDLDLNLTSCASCSELCLIETCIASNDPEPFYYIHISFTRRYMNWIVFTLVAIAGSLLLVFIAIGTYDIMRTKIYSMGKKLMARFTNRRKRI